MNLLRADVPGHALERVRETFGQHRVPLRKRSTDLIDNGRLLLGELAQDFQIQLSIAAHAEQAVLRIEPQASHLFVSVARIALLRKNRPNLRFEEFLLRRSLAVSG